MTSTAMFFRDGPLRGQRRIESGEWREWKVPVIRRRPVTYYHDATDGPPEVAQIEYVLYERVGYDADGDALYCVKSAPVWWSDSLLNDRFRTD